MKGLAVTAVVVAMLVAPNAMADVYIMNLSGNNFSTDEPSVIGEPLNVVGHLSQVQGSEPFPLPGIADWSTEYTLYIYGLELTSPAGDFERNFTGGTIEIWAQSPGNSPWTPTTPVGSIASLNPADVPATFIDGTLVLRGVFSSFTILDFTQFGSATGTITGTDIDWVAGANLADLVNLGIENDWSWNGFFDVTAPVPPGYQLLYGGKLERSVVTPVEPRTWGAIKGMWAN